MYAILQLTVMPVVLQRQSCWAYGRYQATAEGFEMTAEGFEMIAEGFKMTVVQWRGLRCHGGGI